MRKRAQWVWLFAVISVALVGMVGWTIWHHRAPPLEVFGELPSIALTDQQGRSFGTPDLTGKIWVADFIFTRCVGQCPLLTQQMERLQNRLVSQGLHAELVSFSVDPDNDTPGRLAAYAAQHHAAAHWHFLTGSHDQVAQLVVHGFKLPMGKSEANPDAPNLFDIAHGVRFVLVDQRARIRGYFETDAVSTDRLIRAITELSATE